MYLVPSWFGVLAISALFLMLLMAYTYQNNMAYGLTFFLTAFGFVSMIATHRFLMAVRVESHSPKPVYAGQIFPTPVLAPDLDGPMSALNVRPRDSEVKRVERGWQIARRGIHRVERLEIQTTYPTGFFRAWKFVPVELRFVVAPEPRDFGLRPGEDGSALGRRQASGSEELEDLRELRPARPEDPLSRIDWRSLARGRGYLKKEFDAEAAKSVVLKWSDTSSLENPEDRLRQMAAWVRGVKAGTRMRFQGPDGHWTEKTDEALESLARYPAEAP